MDKDDVVVYIHNGILLSYEKMMSVVVTWIVLEIMILSEVNKTQKNIHITSFVCGILKKWYKWTYLQSGNRHINIEHKIYGYERGGINLKFGVNRYTLLYTYNR